MSELTLTDRELERATPPCAYASGDATIDDSLIPIIRVITVVLATDRVDVAISL